VHDVRTRLIGRQMVYPILAAVAVAQAEKRELGPVLAAMAVLEPTANRLEPIRHASGAVILLDAFKGALETIHAALDALDELPARRKIVVLGDVEEPPGSQGPIYKDVGRHVARVAERVYYLGGRTNLARLRAGTMSGGLPREALIDVRTGPLEAAKRLGPELRVGDVVLIKGRSTEHFERIALVLQGTRVGCEVRLCRRRHDCETCPFLHGE
jgi:UDP-N-acetylmuramoyl-tripeptide--D-alanyl-D-alanine ligase